MLTVTQWVVPGQSQQNRNFRTTLTAIEDGLVS